MTSGAFPRATGRPDVRTVSTLQKAARGSLLNFLGSMVSAVATFGLTVVVTRMTSQTDAGVFFSATSLFLLATALGQLGTDTGLVYFLSGSRARGELQHVNTFMSIAMRPVLLFALVIAGAAIVFAEPLGGLLSPGREDEFATYMRVMAFFIPCAAVLNLALAGSQGLGTMGPYATLDQAAKPVLQLVLVGVALAVVGSGSVAWAWSTAYLPVAVLAWLWWRRLRDRTALQVSDPAFRPTGKFWRFSAPRALASVTQVAMQRLDILLVGALAGLTAAAVYGAATRFMVLGQAIGRAVSLSGQPLLGEALARQDLGDARRLYQVTTSWLVVLTWPWYLMLVVFGGLFLQVFGSGYHVGSDVLIILCLAMLVGTGCGMVDMVLNMAGKSTINLLNVLCALFVNIALDIWLIPKIGIVGAAIGWATAILVANLLPLVQIILFFRLHPFGRSTLLGMASSVAAFAVLPLGAVLVWGVGVWVLIVSGLLGATAHAGVIWRFRDLLELDALLGALRRRARPPATI